MAKTELPSIEDLRKVLAYDPETGVLTRVVARGGTKAGDTTGCVNASGYLVVQFCGRLLYAHRIAWALHFGKWPPGKIDHKNGRRADNRIENLRAVTDGENARNMAMPKINTSGRIGVKWHKAGKKWQAAIHHAGRHIHLGLFAGFDEACAARAAAEQQYGFHPNHGRQA